VGLYPAQIPNITTRRPVRACADDGSFVVVARARAKDFIVIAIVHVNAKKTLEKVQQLINIQNKETGICSQ
jgi:hypothetical protein